VRILVTGSRDWTDARVVEVALRAAWFEFGRYSHPSGLTVVHGGAAGADRIAAAIAESVDWRTELHRADWATYGKAAGPIRNQAMVDAGADLVLAFPIGASIGTRDCIRRAEAAGIPVRVYEGPTR
jgi:hypothetical protein